MSSTLVAVFDDHASATAARDALVERQLIRQASDASVTSSESSPAPTGGAAERDGGEPRHGIRAFFQRLFGVDDADDGAGHYAEAVRRGSAVLSVSLADDDKADQAVALLEDCGAIDVDERVSRWKAEGYVGHDPEAPALGGDQLAEEREKMQVLREELQVGKRTVDRGGVRVRRRIIETPVSEQVRLRSEDAVIERVPVDRPATEADFETFKDGELELRETAEEAVVGKRARVVEEVRVGTKASERTETVSDTVRRTDVQVERLDDGFERPVQSRQGGARDDASAVAAFYNGPERRFNTQPYAGTERRAQAGASV